MATGMEYGDEALYGRSDEELVRLARAGAYPEAIRELHRRHGAWMRALIARWAQAADLPADQTEDARQQSLFALRRAVRNYDLAQLDRPRPCHFRTFLGRVLLGRLGDFARSLRRAERHYDRSVPAAVALDARTPAPAADWLARPAGGSADPARVVAWQETVAVLHRVVGELDETQRRLCQAIENGVLLAAAARELGISYPAARRQWQKAASFLAARLGVAG